MPEADDTMMAIFRLINDGRADVRRLIALVESQQKDQTQIISRLQGLEQTNAALVEALHNVNRRLDDHGVDLKRLADRVDRMERV